MLVSSCFLAIWAQRCMLADLIGTFSLHCNICWRLNSAQCLCTLYWVTMNSAGRLADVCLMLQIQSCHCVESATECVCVCSRVYVNKGWEKAGVCFGTKIICQRRCSTAKTCQMNLQGWVFYLSNLFSTHNGKVVFLLLAPTSTQPFCELSRLMWSHGWTVLVWC